MNAGPNIEQAEERARELDRLIMLVESEARKPDYRRARWATVRELTSIAGALRFSLRYLTQAISKAREGVIVCAGCKRETVELAKSRTLDGPRCASCAVPALDEQIAQLHAELERLRQHAPIVVVDEQEPRQPQRLTQGDECQPRRKRRPSARRDASRP